MERNKINIPSVIVEIEIFKVGDRHYFRMIVEGKQVQICIEELKISPLTELLICKWIDNGLKGIKK